MLPEDYRSRWGSGKDRALLVKFMERTYREFLPHQNSFSHLTQTIARYFSYETPLLWVSQAGQDNPIACLWMGNAIDQVSGDRYTHIFLLYVSPEHRRQGIATALIQQAQDWAQSRGDRQIGLQVFSDNQAALKLYQHLGFQTHSLMMLKTIHSL